VTRTLAGGGLSIQTLLWPLFGRFHMLGRLPSGLVHRVWIALEAGEQLKTAPSLVVPTVLVATVTGVRGSTTRAPRGLGRAQATQFSSPCKCCTWLAFRSPLTRFLRMVGSTAVLQCVAGARRSFTKMSIRRFPAPPRLHHDFEHTCLRHPVDENRKRIPRR